jgi:hypothetical protein
MNPSRIAVPSVFTVKVVRVEATKLGPVHYRFYTEQGEPLRWRSVYAQNGHLFVETMDHFGVVKDIGPGRLVDYGTLTPREETP